MPTLGLKDLEVLRLQDTDSLKKFPSIYKFEVSSHGAQRRTVLAGKFGKSKIPCFILVY
jgi:hypothetical protein